VLVYGINPELSRPLNPVLIRISIAIYLFYLFMYYALLVFKMLRAPSVEESVESSVDDLIAESRNRRASDK
jgi:hypothetical protein